MRARTISLAVLAGFVVSAAWTMPGPCWKLPRASSRNARGEPLLR
jgi:hypothetical protein